MKSPDYPSDSEECKILKASEYCVSLGLKEINEPSETPHRLKTFYYLSACNRLLGFILATLVVIWIFQYRGGVMKHNFNWHPFLMIFGMVLIYSRGMLFYRTERSIGMSRLKVMYSRITFGGIICTITGLIAGLEPNEFTAPDKTDQTTLYIDTLHSLVGLTSIILFLFKCITELYSYLYPGVNQNSQSSYTCRYSYLVMGIFVGAVIACFLGFNEVADFLENQAEDPWSENTMIWFIYLTLITFGGLSLYLFSHDCYKRLARPEDEDLLTKTIILKHFFCIPWTFHECTYSFRMLFSRTHFPTAFTTGHTRSPSA